MFSKCLMNFRGYMPPCIVNWIRNRNENETLYIYYLESWKLFLVSTSQCAGNLNPEVIVSDTIFHNRTSLLVFLIALLWQKKLQSDFYRTTDLTIFYRQKFWIIFFIKQFKFTSDIAYPIEFRKLNAWIIVYKYILNTLHSHGCTYIKL